MRKKTILVAFMLVVFAVSIGGCHYRSHDSRRDYSSRSGSYREGYRDGRAADRDRDGRRDRYHDRDWRRRW